MSVKEQANEVELDFVGAVERSMEVLRTWLSLDRRFDYGAEDWPVAAVGQLREAEVDPTRDELQLLGDVWIDAVTEGHARLEHCLDRFMRDYDRTGMADRAEHWLREATRGGVLDDPFYANWVQPKLQGWLMEHELAIGDVERAVDRGIERFNCSHTSDDYRDVMRLEPNIAQRQRLEDLLRAHRPDLWILAALERGDVESAIECYLDAPQNPWPSDVSERLARAVSSEHPDIARMCFMEAVDAVLRRRSLSRRDYAYCATLLAECQALLEADGRAGEWSTIVSAFVEANSHRRAFIDELARAGLVSPDVVPEPRRNHKPPKQEPDSLPPDRVGEFLRDRAPGLLDQPWQSALREPSTRLRKALRRAGFVTIGEVVRGLDTGQLIRIANVGEVTLKEFRALVSERLRELTYSTSHRS